MKRCITSDNILPSSLRFPCNYPQSPHRFTFLPLRHLLSLHLIYRHLTSVSMFSGSWPLRLAFLQLFWRSPMHVFQQHGDPLKSSRLQQYLHEGCEGWYMPMVAEAIPGSLRTSVFLFFTGLSDLLFNINTTVGISTVAPIGTCGLLFILIPLCPSYIHNRHTRVYFPVLSGICSRSFMADDSGIEDPMEE
jgi:hypothetical protein